MVEEGAEGGGGEIVMIMAGVTRARSFQEDDCTTSARAFMDPTGECWMSPCSLLPSFLLLLSAPLHSSWLPLHLSVLVALPPHPL